MRLMVASFTTPRIVAWAYYASRRPRKSLQEESCYSQAPQGPVMVIGLYRPRRPLEKSLPEMGSNPHTREAFQQAFCRATTCSDYLGQPYSPLAAIHFPDCPHGLQGALRGLAPLSPNSLALRHDPAHNRAV